MNSRCVWLVLWLAFFFGPDLSQGGRLPRLQCFFSDNHAESFRWFSQVLDLDEPATLILIDHHSDASWAEHSDDIREGLRRVVSTQQRAQRCEQWRREGRIQAYNWIEPLMPRPFENVLWIPRETLDLKTRDELITEARDAIDGRMEFEKRSAGSLAQPWHVLAADDLAALANPTEKLAASIDLDYFMDMDAQTRTRSFARLWKWLIGQPNLMAVSFSLSRPWLRSQADADALTLLAFQSVEGVRGALFTVFAGVDDYPDDSRQYRELQKKLGAVPKWDAGKLRGDLRSMMVRQRDLWQLMDQKRDWNSLLDEWLPADGIPSIHLSENIACTDGIHRIDCLSSFVLRIAPLPQSATGRVRWYEMEPCHVAADLIPETEFGKAFAKNPSRWIAETRRFLCETKDAALPIAGSPDALGRYRYVAEVECDDCWVSTPVFEIRRTQGTSFHAGLSECFRMPYVFGIALEEETGATGVETGWGSDCSNLIAYAWRRAGVPLQWGDPGMVASQLHVVAQGCKSDVSLPLPQIAQAGVAVRFDAHMAALWEDREPKQVLTKDDLFVHHLGKFPEILTLEKLAHDRPAFSVLVLPEEQSCEVSFLGDCVLKEANAAEVASVLKCCDKSDAVFLNLEGVPSLLPAVKNLAFDFRFAAEKLSWLSNSKIAGISLANNHAGDAGVAGLTAALKECRRLGLPIAGADKLGGAVAPVRTTRNGVPLAFFAVSAVESLVATDAQPGVAHLPTHREQLKLAIRSARNNGDVVLVMVHWGSEYTATPNAEQRAWANWLLQCGANAVIGAHPHVVQPVEHCRGGLVAYSLGNAIYPEKLRGLDSGILLRIRITEKGRILSCEQEALLAPLRSR